MLTKNSHMSYSDRQIIETGIENGSTKQAIATTLGKDKSAIGKEIKLHRVLAYKCNLPLECANYKRCKHERYCTLDCIDYVPFKCTRRDKSPGACNGCGNYRSCRYDKYRYSALDAQHDYQIRISFSIFWWDKRATVSTCIKTTLMITLHQEIGLHARCTMEVGKGNLV